MQPIEFSIDINDFDYSLIKVKESASPEEIREAIGDYFADELKKHGGDVKIAVTEEAVMIKWIPVSSEEPQKLIEYVISLLQKGAYDKAEPILKVLYKQFPDNFKICHNYGMMLSDKNELPKAIDLLKNAVKICSEAADSWNALGVAYQRSNDLANAKDALMKSYDLEPSNPYTLKNLGALLAASTPKDAIKFLEPAANMLPNDQQAQYGYAMCLFQLGKYEKADEVLTLTIDLSPYSQIAELCRQLRTEISHKSLRIHTSTGERPDATMYCLAALRKYKELGPEKRQTIAFEIGMLGRNGLDINSPEQKYSLKSLEGKFSGLQLVCYMYVGFKQIDSSMDVGIDFANEYKQALEIFNSEK